MEFNFFKKEKTHERKEIENIINFSPENFEDLTEIIKRYKYEPVIVNLKNLKVKNIQRSLDILTGAVCSLDGKICELEKNIYLLVK